jgi:hypothetical protein
VQQRTVVAAAALADGNLAVNGDFEICNNTHSFSGRCSWSFFRASTTSPRPVVIRNLVADFSAGNGGAVDAVVTAKARRKGNPNEYRIVRFA